VPLPILWISSYSSWGFLVLMSELIVFSGYRRLLLVVTAKRVRDNMTRYRRGRGADVKYLKPLSRCSMPYRENVRLVGGKDWRVRLGSGARDLRTDWYGSRAQPCVWERVSFVRGAATIDPYDGTCCLATYGTYARAVFDGDRVVLKYFY
jgi:hypothetical protein